MTLRAHRLPSEVIELSPFARAVLDGELQREGLTIARSAADVPRPEERFVPEERELLAQTLERALTVHEPPVAVLDAVRALAHPGTTVVVTGQQPGFLAAPAYSLYKALQAIRVARELAREWQRPVVPLFWNHADDHDIAEVHHSWVLNAHLDVQRVALAGLSSGKLPISRLPLDDERSGLSALRPMLAQTIDPAHPDAPGTLAAVDLFLPREGETLASAFTRILTRLLGHLGLVVFEPDWLREDLSRALAQVVGRDVAGALARGSAGLRAAGQEPTIDPTTAALVYRVDEQGRHALRSGGEGFRYDDEPGSRTPEELAAEIVADPASWSPGALLRPLVQDLCLPVATYVGGWGELAYQAQLIELREDAGVPATPLTPRVSITLVDPATRRSLEKLGLEVADVLASMGAASSTGGREGDQAEPPPAVLAKLDAIAETAVRDLLALRAELAELDVGISKNLPRSADQLRDLIGKVRDKAGRVHANRTGGGRRHQRRVASVLCPRDLPQERVLGPLPWVVRFGTDWIEELLLLIDPFDPRHLVVDLEDSPATEGEAL